MTAAEFFDALDKHITDNTEEGAYRIDGMVEESELFHAAVDELRYAFILHYTGLAEPGITPCHKLMMLMFRKTVGIG